MTKLSPPMLSFFHHRFLAPAVFFVIGFCGNLLWEVVHLPLYEAYRTFDWQFFVSLKAAGGDMYFMLIIYSVLAIIHRDIFWAEKRKNYSHPATWIITLIIGFLLAVSFELWAVYVDHRWIYAKAMPIIPVLQVGLAPVSQMLLIPILTLFVTKIFSKGN